METFATKTKGIYILFDGKTARVVDKAELTKQLEFNQAQLASLPAKTTDKDLLAWAKENYPSSATEKSRTLIEAEISKLQTQLASCK